GGLAHRGGDVDVGQEVHLDLDRAVALARLAAAALDVEGEPSGLVAALARLRGPGEQVADVREDAGVGGRVGPWGAADGALVDLDDLVDVLDAGDAPVRPRRGLGAVQGLGERGPEYGVHQGGLARAGRPGDTGERAERDADVDVLEVVLLGALYDEALAVAFPPSVGHGDLLVTPEVGGGEGAVVAHELLGRALRHDLAAVHAGARAEVDDVVGRAHGLLVVLDDDERVAEVPEVVERAQE